MSVYMNATTNPRDSDYRKTWHKTSQILRPGPSRALVFIDEHEKSIQQSTFCLNANGFQLFGAPQWAWISFPATRHNKGCCFSFADGHAEVWKWRGPYIFAPAANLKFSNTNPNDPDARRIQETVPLNY